MVGLFRRSRPFRKPYPDDFVLGSLRGRLARSSKTDTQYVVEIPPDQAQVAPTEFGELAQNPVFGQPYAYRNFRGGMGQRRLRKGFEGRVWYCLNARTRGGYLIQGPALTSYTPGTTDATNGVTRFFEIGGHIYAGAGRYILDGGTDGTGWTVSKDLGSGKRIYDAAVAQQNASGSTRYAFVGLGDSDTAQKFDGTTWTDWTGINARALAVAEEQMWLVDDANRPKVCDLDADLTNSANWIASTSRIGTRDQAVTRIAVDGAGGLVYAKADDLYTIDGNGDQHRLFGERQFPPASTNGEALGRWGDNLYVAYGAMSYRLSPDGGLTPIGTGMLRDNGSPVAGRETAWCGTDFFALVGLWNDDDSKSYLLEYAGESVKNAHGQDEPVYHGSITPAFSGKKITTIHQSALGASTGYKMAFLGFSDGTITKYVLANTPDPADADQERFSTSTGYCYLPKTVLYFAGEPKALHRATVEADILTSSSTATVGYTTDGNATATTLGPYRVPGAQSLDFADGASCRWIAPYLQLATAASTATPQISGLALEWELRTAKPRQVLGINIIAEDGQRKRDGTPYRYGAEAIRALVEAMAGSASSVDFSDSEETARRVTVKMPKRVVAYDEMSKPRSAINVTLVETRQPETRGILHSLERYRLRDFNAYPLGGLEDL